MAGWATFLPPSSTKPVSTKRLCPSMATRSAPRSSQESAKPSTTDISAGDHQTRLEVERASEPSSRPAPMQGECHDADCGNDHALYSALRRYAGERPRAGRLCPRLL